VKHHVRVGDEEIDWDDDPQSFDQSGVPSTSDDVTALAANAAVAAGSGGSQQSSAAAIGGGSAGAQHLVINLTFDSSVNAAPAAFKTAVLAAAQFFENTFTNPVTINIAVGYGEVGGYSLGGALGESDSYLDSTSYSQLANALRSNATTAAAAAASLPATDPTGGGTFWLTTAEAKALGLSGYYQGLDGYVGFSSSYAFCYNDSNGVPADAVDFFGVATHEISEVLGRQMMDGASNGYEPLDLFHYSSSGVRSFTGTQTGYFSIDSGKTDLANFNTNPGGDFGDWASSVGNDAFLAYCPSGTVNPVSTADLAVMSALGWNQTGGAPLPAVARTPVFADFDGNGTSDILWQNKSSKALTDFLTSNGSVSAVNNLATPPSAWTFAGIGDFNDDGTSDILWQNSSTGALAADIMSNGTVSSWDNLGTPGSRWSVVGIGDFNGDDTSDILWRDPVSGQTTELLIGGGSIASTVTLGIVGTVWQVAAIGDFNGDGTADILWRNRTTGADVIFDMNGGNVASTADIGAVGTAWAVAGVGDFDGDGTSDLLWRNAITGDTVLFLMHQNSAASVADLGIVSTAWTVAEVGDFNGDGKADILWRNGSTGADIVFLMSGPSIASVVDVGGVSTSWSVQKPVLSTS
jgi:hypothetical protein